MSTAAKTAFPTVGQITSRLGVPVHRVVYVVESRNIEPAGMAGHARVFSEADVKQIASELRRIERDRNPAAFDDDPPRGRDAW